MTMDLADHIFEKRAHSANPEWIADILTRLLWLTEDNGQEITNSLRRWIGERDPLKVQIALLVDEVWLWESHGEMEDTLGAVVARFPALSELCTAQRGQWNQQFPSRSP
jgi:hypothetical protein